MMIGGHLEAVRTILLIGADTRHSYSRAIWNEVFLRAALPLCYANVDVGATELPEVMQSLREPATLAANVTMPHKASAVRWADWLDDDVSRLDATNFVVNRSGELHAYNTDAVAVRHTFGLRSVGSALLVGAGGAGSAAAGGLLGRVDRLIVLDQRLSVAEDLARRVTRWGMDGEARDLTDLESLARTSDLVVNATPMGSGEDEVRSPIAAEWLLHQPLVYDFAYRSRPTPLQEAAKLAGAPFNDGLTHLAEQAVAMLPILGLDRSLADQICLTTARVTGRRLERWAEDAPSSAAEVPHLPAGGAEHERPIR